jgi:hypothetical protein
MNVTHSYEGLGLEYYKTRRGTPKFAKFMLSKLSFDKSNSNDPLAIVEFGIGSGQQTEFLEKELNANGISKYNIIAFDKSYKQSSSEIPSQFDILK